jgi:hypothetical protein
VYLQVPLLNKRVNDLLARILVEQEAVPSLNCLVDVVVGAHQSVKVFPDMFRPYNSITLATDSNQLLLTLSRKLFLGQNLTSFPPNFVLTLYWAIQ